MKIAKALKLKNQLAGEVAQLKELLIKQNSRSSKQKSDYDNREVLTRLRAKVAELVKVKAVVAAANAEIYDKIFRLAELKGLVTMLTGLDTKAGVFHEGGRFGDAGYEVEYIAQIGKWMREREHTWRCCRTAVVAARVPRCATITASLRSASSLTCRAN